MTDDITPLLPPSEMPRLVSLRALSQTDSWFPIEATEQECAAIAQRLRLSAVDFLKGKLTARLSSDQQRIFIGGIVAARVVQPCVVTLEPVTAEIEEKIELVFGRNAPDQWPDEIDVASADEEWPEILRGDDIDLGEIAIQAVSLGVPEYPRAQDAVFDADKIAGHGRISPFAVLQGLKDKT